MTAASDADNDRSSRLVRGAAWLTVGITAISLVPSVGYFLPRLVRFEKWSADVAVWLPLVQLSGMAGLLLWHGRPCSRQAWWVLGLLNGWCLGAAFMRGLNLAEVSIAFVVGVGVRLGVILLWGGAVIGFPLVVLLIAREQAGRRFSRLSVRLWMVATLTLLTAEPLCWVLLQSSEELPFPESLPPPPAGELRIVALGSSTMVGHPYEPKFGIPQFIAWRVQAMYPDQHVVLENLAVPGQSLRDAILQLQRLSHRPQLIVLYGGHNEFMHELGECLELGSSPLNMVDGLLMHSPLFRLLQYHLNCLRIMRNFRGARLPELVTSPLASPVVADIRLRRFERRLVQLARFG